METNDNFIKFSANDSVVNVYETSLPAQSLKLHADQLLYCGMIKGHKIMHNTSGELKEKLHPHESFVISPDDDVEINFPSASKKNPTTCLTIEISRERVQSVCNRMNELHPLPSALGAWRYEARYLHTHHTTATQGLLERLVHELSDASPDSGVIVDLGISELIVRMLREQGREFLLNYAHLEPDASGMTSVIFSIKERLNEHLDINELCRLACMSRTRLYTIFKNQLGCTPSEFQQQLRLKEAATKLAQGLRVSSVCFELGYNDLSHFSRRFRQRYGCSPREYRDKYHHPK